MNKFMLHTFLKIHIIFNPSDIQLNNHTRPFSDMHYYSNSWIWLPFYLEVLAVFPSEYQHKISFSNSHEDIFWKPCRNTYVGCTTLPFCPDFIKCLLNITYKTGLQITTGPLSNASNFYLWAKKTLGFDRPHGE